MADNKDKSNPFGGTDGEISRLFSIDPYQTHLLLLGKGTIDSKGFLTYEKPDGEPTGQAYVVGVDPAGQDSFASFCSVDDEGNITGWFDLHGKPLRVPLICYEKPEWVKTQETVAEQYRRKVDNDVS